MSGSSESSCFSPSYFSGSSCRRESAHGLRRSNTRNSFSTLQLSWEEASDDAGSRMSIVKSLAVGDGDMFYIRHNSDNFTIIDCSLYEENEEAIISELKAESADKGV